MNKFLLACILILSFPLSSFADVSGINSATNMAYKVSVVVQTPSGGYGSGVVIKRSSGTYVITALHVVHKIKKFRTKRVLGKTYKIPLKDNLKVLSRSTPKLDKLTHYSYSASVVEICPANDLAILKISGETHFKYSAVYDFDHRPKIGEMVAHAGAMGRLTNYNMTTLGNISQVSLRNAMPYGPAKLDSCTANWYPGSSGGAVFNAEGKVIGLAVQWQGKPLTSVYVPSRAIKAWALKESKHSFLFKPEVEEEEETNEESLPLLKDLEDFFRDHGGHSDRQHRSHRSGSNRFRKTPSNRRHIRNRSKIYKSSPRRKSKSLPSIPKKTWY